MPDLAALAATRAAPPPDLAVAQMRKDKKEAVRLARLKLKANNRGAAPPPPGKGGGAAPVVAAAPGGEAPKVSKYRAVEDHQGEISYEKGATLFVLGEPDASGNVVAVANGASGNVPFSTMIPITDELLTKEREEKEAAFKAAREAREKELEDNMAQLEMEEEEKLKALESSAPKSDEPNEEEVRKEAAKKAAQEKVAKEIEEMKAEEERLIAEAKKLEELMAALDMSDDEDGL